ncbi:MFS transporter [Alicyclobacillus curvatus]|nr:MFS transporter [Alicyclobacillus curvatus]
MSILKNRNFSFLFFGQLVSTFGDNLYALALPWLVYELTNSKMDLALSSVAGQLPAIAGLFVGVFVDRWNKRWTMIGADSIRLIIVLIMFLIAVFRPQVWLLLGLVVMIKLVGTVFSPARSALIPLILSSEDIPAASGFEQSGIATTRLISNVSGGVLLTLFGAAELFLMDSVSFLVSLISLLFVNVQEAPRTTSQADSFISQWTSGFRYILGHNTVLRVVVTAVLANFALVPTETVLVAWVKGPMHGAAYVLGITMAAISIGMVIGGMALQKLSKVLSVRTVLIMGLASTGLCIGFIGLDTNQFYIMVMLLVVGFEMGVMNGAIGSFYLLTIDPEFRGRTLSTLRAVASLAAPAGAAIYGVLMVHVPLQWVFALLGLPIFFSGLIMLSSQREASTSPSYTVEA